MYLDEGYRIQAETEKMLKGAVKAHMAWPNSSSGSDVGKPKPKPAAAALPETYDISWYTEPLAVRGSTKVVPAAAAALASKPGAAAGHGQSGATVASAPIAGEEPAEEPAVCAVSGGTASNLGSNLGSNVLAAVEDPGNPVVAEEAAGTQEAACTKEFLVAAAPEPEPEILHGGSLMGRDTTV